MTADPHAPETETSPPTEPVGPVLSVTLYDRLVALLLSLICTTGGLTLALGAIWWTNHATGLHSRVTPVHLLDIDLGEDWGGVPDGGPDDSWDNPGPPGAEPAVSGDQEGSDGSELQRSLTGLLGEIEDAVELSEQLLNGSDTQPVALQVGWRGTDRDRPRGGAPGPTRGVPLNRRWEIVFAKELTVEEYARQLDFLGVELGIIIEGKLYKVVQHASSRPAVREADPALARKELFFIWRDESRRQVDLSLLRRAPLKTVSDGAVVLHFYPMATVQQLGELEREHAASHGRTSLRDVAKTRFTVQESTSGYRFEITQQTYLASREP